MESTNELSRKHPIMPSSDRISRLPDPILCHILSYLPTKNYAATSLIARRWRFLWTHVDNLDFNSLDLLVYKGDSLDNYFAGIKRFSYIVNRVLMLHNSRSINTFRLPFHENCDKSELDTWISTAIARRVKVLDLDLIDKVSPPMCLFKCNTLVDLRLCSCICSAGAVCLPNLKKLHLQHLVYEDDESLPNLISGCLVLEELIVERNLYSDDNMHCCNISSSTLKRLTLHYHSFLEEFNIDYTLVLNTPALRYLHLEDYLYMRISAGSLSSLIEANIHIQVDSNIKDILFTWSIYKFVKSVSTVKFLKFSSQLKTEFLSPPLFSFETSRFDNLIKLDLEAELCLLTKFLETADKLQVLIIRQVWSYVKRWKEPRQIPVCLLSSLRIVTVHRYEGGEPYFPMLSYILKNAKSLEKMEIYSDYRNNPDDKLKMLQKISLCRRGSEKCEVALY